MPEESERRLEIVRQRASKTFDPDTSERWLVRCERFLNGRRPIDAIRAGEVKAVLASLDAIDANEY